MRNKFLLVLTILVAGCNSSGSSDQGPVHFTGDSPAVETVNGVVISQALLDAYVRGHNVNLGEPDARQKALKDLADYVLLSEEAKRAQYDTGVQFQADVEVTRLQAIATATAAQIEKQTPLSDETLKAEYDQQIARAGKFIYSFSQLLFADEADALGAAGDIVSGKPFSEVFETWKKKAKQAKTYPQVRLSQLPEPLAKVVQELKPGDSTKVPIKTEFGWHVLNLVSTTPFVPTSFDTVKEAVRRTMLEQALSQRVKTLREQAQIIVVGGTPAAERPAVPAAPSAASPAPEAVKKN
ncbi:peptidyl-prolyl cis-trans isomerase [Pseudolysobacter antarcticus]|uniref:peptidylprolyl isomerase n=1 Tax=Pseudolysobacter antarcticus TaxID=2511995 RepID=A0A411HIV9_9GAMM|nr:peptidyl-prolyl cis-trans isomerase [Pseudolysobacter antarcticus]QBB70330.1 peptidyl-prolyl cis-trans isomerase [Pseudolysobacter antarcticus]